MPAGDCERLARGKEGAGRYRGRLQEINGVMAKGAVLHKDTRAANRSFAG